MMSRATLTAEGVLAAATRSADSSVPDVRNFLIAAASSGWLAARQEVPCGQQPGS
jgi:hypothetical protein